MDKQVGVSKEKMKAGINMFEHLLTKQAGAEYGDQSDCPLKHTFVPGMYIREIHMPKGKRGTSKTHKVEHPYFIMKGVVDVVTEEGLVRIHAPYFGITPAGTKRIVSIIEDTTWITIHATTSTNMEEIEMQIIDGDNDKQILESFNKEVTE